MLASSTQKTSSETKPTTATTAFPRRLAEIAFLTVVMGLFIDARHWLLITLTYFLFRVLNSDLGRRCIKTLPRDLKGVALLIRVKLKIKWALRKNRPLHEHFLHFVKKHPAKECVAEVETGRSLNFAEFNEHCNKYANAFQKRGYKKDEVVALFLENGIDFFALWMGLSKIGVVTAWINSNLKLEPLAHSIKVSKCRTVVTSEALLPAIKSAMDSGLLDKSLKIYLVNGAQDGCVTLAPQLSDSAEPRTPSDLDFQSILCYIYTSGTTGNPKPAIIKHYRYYWLATGSGEAFEIQPADRIYITMPMYHSAAGIIGIGQVVVRGSSAIIRKKFSASNFWRDCVKYTCSASQYIGEICRYLLASPPVPEEKQHQVRVMYGNGLRGEIWSTFVERFGIKKIGELYGSTEGNSNIVNIDNHVGACGFFPIYPFMRPLYPVRLIRVDAETGELLRDADGLCIPCQPGDTGEMVGMIKEGDPLLRFEGYLNNEDTSKKIIRDVMKKGDVVFASGDILYWDRLGYLYFKDRRGDTYRWRGENVSTMEVEGILQPILDIQDATVYGVEVPGREGRAGMVGLRLSPHVEDVDKVLEDISRRVHEHLAAFAIPVFLRICKEVDQTGTYKLKKLQLQKESFFNERCAGDSLYFWNAAVRRYELLTAQMEADIVSGAYNKI